MRLAFAVLAAWGCFAAASRVDAAPASPSVRIVVPKGAPRLEQFAASEIAGQFSRLFHGTVKVERTAGGVQDLLILVGSPSTNPAVGRVLGKAWPKLSDQGHVLKSASAGGRPALVVGGGSPVATLWAAYELGHHLGIRYLLSGDVLPAVQAELPLAGLDLVFEPTLRTRTWRTVNDFAIGPESWGIEEQRRVLAQLAKLKFNRVMLALYPWQPFVHFEFQGVAKKTAMLWYGYRYPIDGDTPGRTVFDGAREFYNPDLAGKNSYEELTAAGIELIQGILATADGLGMSTAIAISPLEFSREFAEVLPEAKTIYGLENLTVGPGPRQPPDDSLLAELVKTQLRAYSETYPTLDALYLSLPEFPDWVEHHQAAWQRLDRDGKLSEVVSLEQLESVAKARNLVASGERGLQALRGNLSALAFFHNLLADKQLCVRADGQPLEVNLIQVDPALFPVLDRVVPPDTGVLHLVDYTARRTVAHPELIAAVPARRVRSSLIMTLADDNVGVLPQLSTRQLHTLVGQIRENGWDGFSTRYWIAGDLDPAVYYLARASFDDQVTPESATADLVTAMCGEGVAERLLLGFDKIEEATLLTDENNLGFAFPVPGVVMKHYVPGEPPAWWKQASDLYGAAMDEMYRAHDRSHLNGRPFLRHMAKRCEFALEYLACVDSLRRAGQAKADGDTQGQTEKLEAAVESMYNALSALAEVAADNSDRGVIAVLGEYGYRPLVRELEAVSALSN